MAETTERSNYGSIGYARDDGSNTDSNQQLGRKERQHLGRDANIKAKKSSNLMAGEQELKKKDQRRLVADYLAQEGERIYNSEEIKNLPTPPLARLFKEEEGEAKWPFPEGWPESEQKQQESGGQQQQQRNNNNQGRRRRNRRRGRGGRQQQGQQQGQNLQWRPKQQQQQDKEGGWKRAQQQQGGLQGDNQIGGQRQQQGLQQQGQQQQQGQGRRRRQRGRRRGHGGGAKAQAAGQQQSWGEKIKEKGTEFAEKAGDKMESLSSNFDADSIKEKGKEIAEKTGDAIDQKLSDWNPSASSEKPSYEKEEKKFESSKFDSSTEAVENYTVVSAVTSLASDLVEKAGETLVDLKDSALHSLGFDTSPASSEPLASSEEKAKQIEYERKDAEKEINSRREAADLAEDGQKKEEGYLESTKELLHDAFETVKEKAGAVVEFVSEKAVEAGLTLEPSMVTIGDKSMLEKMDSDSNEKKLQSADNESFMDKTKRGFEGVLNEVERAQPI